MATSPLLSLPDEVILRIVSRLVNPFRTVRSTELLEQGPTDYYHNLNHVALLCRRLSAIVREVILTDPIVPFTKLDRLVRTYLDYPELAPKAHSLEIVCGYNKSLNFNGDGYGWPKVDDGFRKICIEVIRRQSIDEKHKDDWISELDERENRQENDHIIADFEAQDPFLGLLLVTLPNLRRLLLGALNITKIPALVDLLLETSPSFESTKTTGNQRSWHYGYLKDAFLVAAPRITQLEVPLHWTVHGFTVKSYIIPSSVESLFPFRNLRKLTIPVEVFQIQAG